MSKLNYLYQAYLERSEAHYRTVEKYSKVPFHKWPDLDQEILKLENEMDEISISIEKETGEKISEKNRYEISKIYRKKLNELLTLKDLNDAYIAAKSKSKHMLS